MTPAPPSPKKPTWLKLSPALFVFLWSTGFVGAKFGLPYAPPFTFLSLRFILSAALFALLAAVFRHGWPSRQQAMHGLLSGMLVHGVYLGTVFYTISKGMPAGISALIVGLQPLATSLLATFIGERPSWKNWFGLALGIAGVGLVVWPKLGLHEEGVTLVGVGLLLVGILSISIGSIYQKRFFGGLSLFSGGAYQFLGALLVSLLGALLLESPRIDPTAEFIFALFWMVVILSIGAISLYTLLIRHGDVSKVAGLFYLVPASTAVLAYFMFGETLNSLQIVGMGVCMAGVALASWRRS
ncbi:drug/metabolite transporter (DMT)-like permease [Rhodoligotrophos appendicifer]|uniref:DMT family transporter n=1 Tax=Rhodoligotrophos appendicifer TaxID=987056 RepID=UPI0011848067|nr:EamA family transporter [Rhodoligotrophos appendicifer]